MAEKGIFFRLARKDDYYEEISEFVASLRKEGRLAKVLKNGLTLMWDLMNYRTDELLRQFPWIRESICPPTSGNGDVARELAELRREVHQMRQERQNEQRESSIPDVRDYGIPAMKPAGKLAAHTLALPTFDDGFTQETIVITKHAPPPADNTGNLLTGIFGVAG